jgi:uncharacterized protein (DUF952 family)
MVMWTTLPADKATAPEKLELGVGTLDAVLVAVAAHVSCGRHMSKERVNLDALDDHCGTKYAQALAVPEALFESLRAVYGIVPFVLLPPLDDEDAVVLLADWHGALKGLPPNERANVLCNAAGTPFKVRGDVFIGRVRVEGGALTPGADMPPPTIMEREWLEAAQSANKVGAGKEEAQQLGGMLGAYAAAAVAQVQSQKAAQESEPPAAAAAATLPPLFHLVPLADWEKLEASGEDYLPATYDADGFTHMTEDASVLLTVANHFYTDIPGEFIVLSCDQTKLKGEVKYEPAAPVGEKASYEKPPAEDEPLFPHLYGPIELVSVTAKLAVARDADGKFLSIAFETATEPGAAAAAAAPGEAEVDATMGVLTFEDNSTDSDTAQSVTATVRVPAETKAKHVQCEVNRGRLLLRVETLPAEKQTVVDGELFQAIDEHTWGLEDEKGGARLLTLELEKSAGVVGHVRWLSLTR